MELDYDLGEPMDDEYASDEEGYCTEDRDAEWDVGDGEEVVHDGVEQYPWWWAWRVGGVLRRHRDLWRVQEPVRAKNWPQDAEGELCGGYVGLPIFEVMAGFVSELAHRKWSGRLIFNQDKGLFHFDGPPLVEGTPWGWAQGLWNSYCLLRLPHLRLGSNNLVVRWRVLQMSPFSVVS